MRLISLLAVLFLMSACTGTIHKRFDLNNDTSLVTDARQRVVSNIKLGNKQDRTRINPNRIICTEPSPDVATVLASGVAAGISVGHQGSGSLGASTAEGLLQLSERTTAIQALRDFMYQTCLTYANGAINGTTYSIKLSEANDTLVTLLYGEYASGAYGRSLGAIGSGSSAAASTALGELGDDAKDIEGTTKNIDEKDAEIANLKLKLEVEEAELTTKGDAATQADKDKVEAAKLALKTAVEQKSTLLEKLKRTASNSAVTSARAEKLIAAGAIDNKLLANTNLDVLNKMQERFIHKDFYNKIIDVCMAEMGNFDTDLGIEMLVRGVDADSDGEARVEKHNEDIKDENPIIALFKAEKEIEAAIKASGLESELQKALLSQIGDNIKKTPLGTWCTRSIAAITIQATKNQQSLRKTNLVIENLKAKAEHQKVLNIATDKTLAIQKEKNKQELALAKQKAANTLAANNIKKEMVLAQAQARAAEANFKIQFIKACNEIEDKNDKKFCLGQVGIVTISQSTSE